MIPLVDQLAAGMTAEVRTNLGTFTVTPKDLDGPASLPVRLLQPAITLRSGSTVLLRDARHGEPDPRRGLVVALVALLVLWWVLR